MKSRNPIYISAAVFAGILVIGGAPVQAAGESVQGMLAAQIRSQGIVCDKALKATRDAKRSRPDHAVWMLECSNARYRVSRAPDMDATVERLR